MGSAAAEGLTAVLAADLVDGLGAAMPPAALFGVVPVPQLLVTAPAAPGGFQAVLVLAGVAADPEPGTAKLHLQAVHAEQPLHDVAELVRGLGGLVVLVGLLIVGHLQDLVHLVICQPGGSGAESPAAQ